MSLSSRLSNREVRADLKPFIRNPGLSGQTVQVQSTTNSANRIGVAFDYLLRFGLANRYDVVERRTGAETGAGMAPGWAKTREEVFLNLQTFEAALKAARSGTADSRLDRDAARASLILAGFEIVYRSGRFEAAEVEPNEGEIQELVDLFEIVPWSRFEPKRRLVSNPEFGEGSELLGGADADLILDDLVVEFKTVKSPKVNLEMTRQVVCYALLANRFGINDERESDGIERIGFYLSRCGALVTTSLADCIEREHHDKVLDILLSGALGL